MEKSIQITHPMYNTVAWGSMCVIGILALLAIIVVFVYWTQPMRLYRFAGWVSIGLVGTCMVATYLLPILQRTTGYAPYNFVTNMTLAFDWLIAMITIVMVSSVGIVRVWRLDDGKSVKLLSPTIIALLIAGMLFAVIMGPFFLAFLGTFRV